jgi:hypothetical protein
MEQRLQVVEVGNDDANGDRHERNQWAIQRTGRRSVGVSAHSFALSFCLRLLVAK